MMGFLQSPLIKGIEQGKLPTVETTVTVEKQSILNVGIMLGIVAVSVAVLVVVVRLIR